jgi:hypothetical protein
MKFILSLNVPFVSTGQLTPPLTVIVCQVLIERNVSLLITGDLDNGYDLLPAEEKRGTLDESFYF